MTGGPAIPAEGSRRKLSVTCQKIPHGGLCFPSLIKSCAFTCTALLARRPPVDAQCRRDSLWGFSGEALALDTFCVSCLSERWPCSVESLEAAHPLAAQAGGPSAASFGGPHSGQEPSHGMVLLTFMLSLPTTIKLIQKTTGMSRGLLPSATKVLPN